MDFTRFFNSQKFYCVTGDLKLKVTFLLKMPNWSTNCQRRSLAPDGSNGNGLQLEKLGKRFSSCFRTSSKKSIFIAVA